jgi:hypothetical protein
MGQVPVQDARRLEADQFLDLKAQRPRRHAKAIGHVHDAFEGRAL